MKEMAGTSGKTAESWKHPLKFHHNRHSAAPNHQLLTPARLYQIQNERRQHKLYSQPHLPPRNDDRIGARHERVVNHGKQIWKIHMLGIPEANHHKTFIKRGNVACDKRVGSIDRRDTLEVDMST